MATETIEAIYEQGGFRVVTPCKLKLNEGQKVLLLVEPIKDTEDTIALATRVYDGLANNQVDSIEQHIRRRENFFGEEMPIINFEQLNQIDLETAKKSIRNYTTQNGLWITQFDNYYQNRLNEGPELRMTNLLNIVRYNGWSMNRQNQCTTIIDKIHNHIITVQNLKDFWYLVDNLPSLELRDLPNTDHAILNQLVGSFTNIRNILSGWHQSAGSVCFLTKVILMFNWGQTPGFDTRIRRILGVNNNINDNELVQSLVEIGTWICDFENHYDIKIDEFATEVIRSVFNHNLYPLPLGRSVDIILFSL